MTNNNNPEKNPNQITIELDKRDLGTTNVGLGGEDFLKENVIGMPAGYNPQDYMANKQSNWAALGISLGNAVTGALGEIVSTPGYLFEMLESTWNDVNTWENTFIELGDSISDLKFGEIYQSRKSEAKWFALADAEWWAKTIDQWGPTIAMMAVSMGVGGLTAKGLARLSRLQKYLKAGNIAKAGRAAKNLRAANTISAAVENRLVEGSMEAYETFNATYDKLKADNPNASEDELRRLAGDAAASTFMNNLPLAVLDVLQFDLLLNGLSKYGIGGKFVKGATGLGIEVGTEGFEEGYQYAISNAAQKNAEAAMRGDEDKTYVLEELAKSMSYSDPEIWKSIGQGMAGGVAFTTLGQLASRISGLKKMNDELEKYIPTGNVADQSRINEEILLASIKSHYEHGNLERVIMQAEEVVNDPNASDEDKQRSELISKLAKKYQSDQDKIPEGPARDEQIDMLFRKAVAENDAENILAELTAAENDMAGFYPSPTMENQSYNKLLIRKAVLEGLSYKEKEFEDSRKALLKDVNESLKNMQGEQINTPYDQGLKQGYEHYYTRLIDSHATQKKATELSNPDSIVHVERERKLGVIRGEFEAAKTPDELNKAYEGYVGDEHFRYIREAREEIHNKKADAEVQGAVEPNDPDKMKDFYQDKPFAYRRRFPTAPWPIEPEATETKGPEGNPPTDYINLALNGEGKAGSRASNLLTWEDDSKYSEHGRRLSDLELVALIDRGLVNSNLGNLIAVSGKMPDSLQDKVDASMAGVTNRKISEKTVKQWEKLSDAKKIEVYNGLGLDLDKNAKQEEVDFAELLEEERQAKEAAKLDDYNNSLVPDGANLDSHTEETPINYNEGNNKAEQFIESYDVATFVRTGDSIELHRHEIEINGERKTMLTRKEFMEYFKPIDPQGKGRFDAMPEDKTLVLYNKDGTPVESSFAKSMGIDRDFIRHGKIVVGEKRVGFRVDNTLEGIKKFNEGKVNANTFNVQVVYYDDNNKPHVIGVLKSTNETTRAGYVGLKELRKKLWAEYQKSDKTGVVEFTPKTSIDYVHRGTFNTTKNPNSRMSINQLLQKGMPLLFGVGMFINETYVLDVNADAMPDGENKEMALEMTSAWSTPGNLYMGVKDRFGKVVPFRVFIKSIKKLPEHRWKLLQAIANFDVYSARELVRFRDKYKNNIRPDFNQDLEKHYSDNKISRQKKWSGKFGFDDFVRPGALLNVEGQTVELLKLNKDKTWQIRIWEAVENLDGTTNRLGKSTQNDNFDLETPMAAGKVFAHYAYQYYMSFNLDDHQAQVDVRQINTENYNNEVAPLLEVDGVPGELFHSPGFALNLNQKNEPVAKKNIQAKKGKDGKFRKIQTATQTSTKGKNSLDEIRKRSNTLALHKDGNYYVNKQYKDSDLKDIPKDAIYSRVSSFYKEYNQRNADGLYENIEKDPGEILKSAQTIGNKVDALVREVFSEEGVDLEKYYNNLAPKEQVDAFYNELLELADWFEQRGETVITEDIILFDEELGIAGTVDMLTVDKSGNYRIYDMKTMRGNNFNQGKYDQVWGADLNDFGNDALSKQEKHRRQLSTYRILLAKKHNVLVKEVGILPIVVDYSSGDTSTKALTFADLKNADLVGTTPNGKVLFHTPYDKIRDLEMPTITGDSFLDAAEEFSQTEEDKTVDVNDRQRVVLNKAGVAYKAQYKTGDTWKDYVGGSNVAKRVVTEYNATNKPTSPVQIISLPNFLYDKIAVVIQGEKRKFVLEYSPLSKKKLYLYPEVKEDGSYTSGGTFPTEADARKLEAKYIPKKLLNKLRKWESKVANAKNAEEAKAEWEELSTFANESFKVEIQAPDLEYTHTDKVIPSFSDIKPFEMAVPTSYGPSGVDVGITMTFESQLQALQYFKSYYSEEPLDFDSEGNMLETNHNSTIANKILQTNDPKELMELGSQYKGFDEKRWFTEENSIREAVYKAANPDLQQEETEIKKGDTVKTAWDDVEYEVTDVKENEVSLKKTVADKSTNIDTSVDKLAGTEQDTPTKKPKKRRGLAALKKNAEKRKLEAKENDLNVNDDNPLNDDCNKV
jgi:hypothetical protein